MSSQVIETYRKTAEISYGDELSKKRIKEVMEEMSLPPGLLPLDGIEESGYDHKSGFVWIIMKKELKHQFKRINRQVSYGTEITSFIEKHRIRKLTGVKTKELLLWISITDIFIPDDSPNMITFNTFTGISDTFPVSSFDPEE